MTTSFTHPALHRRHAPRGLVIILWACGFTACGTDTSKPPAAAADAAAADAGADAGLAADALIADAVVADAVVADTVVADIGSPDTSHQDSGATDVGSVDALTSDATPDTTPSDALVADGGGVPGVICVGKNLMFPAFSKGCQVDADCVAVQHQVNCCGTQIAHAIAKSEATAYQAAEQTCQSQYPDCGCASMPTVAEDGRVALSNGPVVPVCKAGVCLATVPSSAGKCDVSGVKQPQPYKWCQSTKDCTYMLHQVDCCGSQIAWGVTKTSKSAIESTEFACNKLQPICDCIPKPVLAEDGDNAGSGLIAITCEGGLCQSYIK